MSTMFILLLELVCSFVTLFTKSRALVHIMLIACQVVQLQVTMMMMMLVVTATENYDKDDDYADVGGDDNDDDGVGFTW